MKLFLVVLATCVVVSQAAPDFRRLRAPVGEVKGAVADRSSRIYQAEGNADPTQFPFHAHIIVDSAYLFGGALISDSYVLTSALATYWHGNWEVQLGATVLSAKEEWVQRRETRLVTSHPNYLEDNIAVIHFINPVEITAYVKPARLPRYGDAVNTFEGQSAIATGFGQTGDSTVTSDYLRYIRLSVLSKTECDSKLSPPLTDRDLCAQGIGNTCPGDNGGPLVIEETPLEEYTVIGVIAFGAASCESGAPAGFSRVTSYLSWIEETTGIPIAP